MLRRVYGIESCFLANVLRQAHIECAPANIGFHAIDGCVGLGVTEEDQIRRDADPLAVDLEQLPQPDVALAASGVIP